MGTFNACCGVTRLTIRTGDECILLPLVPNKYNKTRFLSGNCPTDNRQSQAMYFVGIYPLIGSYDEYGGINLHPRQSHAWRAMESEFGLPAEGYTKYADLLEEPRHKIWAGKAALSVANLHDGMWVLKEAWDKITQVNADYIPKRVSPSKKVIDALGVPQELCALGKTIRLFPRNYSCEIMVTGKPIYSVYTVLRLQEALAEYEVPIDLSLLAGTTEEEWSVLSVINDSRSIELASTVEEAFECGHRVYGYNLGLSDVLDCGDWSIMDPYRRTLDEPQTAKELASIRRFVSYCSNTNITIMPYQQSLQGGNMPAEYTHAQLVAQIAGNRMETYEENE